MEDDNMTENKKSKKVLIGITSLLAVLALGGGLFLYCRNAQNKVKLIECDSLDAIAAFSSSDTASSSNTIFKIGEDYYSYFASTGAVELMNTSVPGYDSASYSTISNLYNTKIQKLSESTETGSQKMEDVTVFNNVLTARLAYLYKELDNCTANLMLDSDNADWLTYKVQLENEINSILTYRIAVSNILTTLLAQVDADSSLTESISNTLDTSLNASTLSLNYAKLSENQTIYEQALAALQSTVSAQESLLNSLSDNYNNLNELIVNKRNNAEQSVTLVDDSTDFSEYYNYIANLDNRINVYASECADYYDELSGRITALENQSNTLQSMFDSLNTDSDGNNDYSAFLQALSALKDRQTELENKLSALSDLYESGVSAAIADSSFSDDYAKVFQEQVSSQQDELDAIKELLNSASMQSLDSLVDKYDKLQEALNNIEEAYTLADSTLSQEQLDNLEALRSELEALINESILTSNDVNASNLTDIANTLNFLIDALSDSTFKALTDLNTALDDSNAENAKNLTTATDNLYYSLSDDIDDNQRKIRRVNDDLDSAKSALTDDISTLRQDTSNDLSDLRQDTDDAIDMLRKDTATDIASVRQDLATTRDELTQSISDLETSMLQAIVDAKEDVVSQLTDITDYLSTRVSALEELTATHDDAIKDLQDRVSSLESDMVTVKSNITSLQSRVSTLSTQVTASTTKKKYYMYCDFHRGLSTKDECSNYYYTLGAGFWTKYTPGNGTVTEVIVVTNSEQHKCPGTLMGGTSISVLESYYEEK
jgi:hypothetical protein